MKKLLLLGLVALIAQSCTKQNENKFTNETFIQDTIMSLPEIQERNAIIDSISNHTQSISLIIEQSTSPDSIYSVQAGCKNNESFELYYQFYYNPTSKQIFVEDNMSGDRQLLEQWRVNSEDSMYLNRGMQIVENEKFGELGYKMKSSDVIALLGQPTEKYDSLMSELDGLVHQTWKYANEGVELNMCWDEPNQLTISTITLKAPCKLKTTEDIGIGSSRADVMDKYLHDIDSHNIQVNSVIVGSIFGGITISFEDNKVSELYLGAAAE